MEFCNLAGSSIPEEIERHIGCNKGISLKIPFGARESSYSVISNVVTCAEGNNIVIREAKNGEDTTDLKTNLFAMAGDPKKEVMPFYKRKNEPLILWSDVRDTDENPAIIVMCKAIHLVNDVKTYLKVLNVSEDYIVAMLVAGAVGFEVDDGDVLTMTRCCPSSVSVNMRKTKRLSSKEFNDMLSLTDANGYKYNMDMLISVYAYFGSDMVNIKTLRDACVNFDAESESRAKAAADAVAAREARKQALREQQEAKQAEAQARQEEIDRRKAEEAAKEVSAKANTQVKRRNPKPKMVEIGSSDSSGRNAGAEFFLSMLKNS